MEGLLTGNVNLLKLPQADSGLSLEILQKLMELEPDIREFLYVFDTPSSDLGTLKRLADIADGIVVLSLIHISEPTRQAEISYAVFCLKKKTLIPISERTRQTDS